MSAPAVHVWSVEASTTVPDHPGAVDADILVEGTWAGEVGGDITLLPDPTRDGALGIWGDIDHWASAPLVRWLQGLDDDAARGEAADAIVVAVRAAAEERGIV